jgi:hypothetical protein
MRGKNSCRVRLRENKAVLIAQNGASPNYASGKVVVEFELSSLPISTVASAR